MYFLRVKKIEKMLLAVPVPIENNLEVGGIKLNLNQTLYVQVFKLPADNRTDYIKRLIGMPGDKIQFIDGELVINSQNIKRKKHLTIDIH